MFFKGSGWHFWRISYGLERSSLSAHAFFGKRNEPSSSSPLCCWHTDYQTGSSARHLSCKLFPAKLILRLFCKLSEVLGHKSLRAAAEGTQLVCLAIWRVLLGNPLGAPASAQVGGWLGCTQFFYNWYRRLRFKWAQQITRLIDHKSAVKPFFVPFICFRVYCNGLLCSARIVKNRRSCLFHVLSLYPATMPTTRSKAFVPLWCTSALQGHKL